MNEETEQLPEEASAVIRAFIMSEQETKGHLTVTIDSNGKPIEATEFGNVIIRTVRILHQLDETKKYKCGLIEANIIGDKGSFTLKLYHKDQFKVKKSKE